MKLWMTFRQVANVVGGYQNIVMIYAKQKRSDHREGECPKPDRGVARPHEARGHHRRYQDNYEDEEVLFARQLNRKPRMGVTVPERGDEMNNDKTANHNSVNQINLLWFQC